VALFYHSFGKVSRGFEKFFAQNFLRVLQCVEIHGIVKENRHLGQGDGFQMKISHCTLKEANRLSQRLFLFVE